MAACCALGAYIVYKLITFHDSLSFIGGPRDELQPASDSKRATRSHCLIALQGLTCSSCTGAVENACLSIPGVSTAHVTLHSLTARIVYDPNQVNPKRIASEIEQVGFGATPLAQDEEAWVAQWLLAARSRDETVREWTYAFNLSAALSGLTFLLEATESWLWKASSPTLFPLIRFGLIAPAIMWLGMPIHKEAFGAAMRGAPNTSLLASSGFMFTLAAGLCEELDGSPGVMRFRMVSTCLLMTVIIGSRVTKCHFSQRSSQYPTMLASAVPQTAKLVRNPGTIYTDTVSVPVEVLRPGDMIQVDPEENFPVDGTISKGRTSVLETIVTGELTPKTVGHGAQVYAGSSNGFGAVVVEVQRVKNETWLGQTLQAMAQSSEAKSKIERFSDRLLARFSAVVICLAMMTGAFHWSGQASITTIMTRIATVLLCACPCTIDMGVSVCLMASASAASKAGILLKPGFHAERTADARAIIFDKTGTLTSGELHIQARKLEKHWTADRMQQNLFWELVGNLARQSSHPVSTLLSTELRRRVSTTDSHLPFETQGLELLSHDEHPGLGLTGVFACAGVELKVVVGNQRLMQTSNIYCATEQNSQGPSAPLPLGYVYVAINNTFAGRIAYTDTIVNGASDLIHTLHSRGLNVFMMTGDTRTAATAVAERVGIPASHVYASLLPFQKASMVKRLEDQYGHAVMVGDNANDVPALVAATFGILVCHHSPPQGSALSRLQTEPDALLLPHAQTGSTLHGLQRVIYTLELIQATARRMHQILWFSFVYNISALCLASGLVAALLPGRPISWLDLDPSSASLAMSISSILTLWFSLRLREWRPAWYQDVYQ